MQREPGDRITVTEAATGLSGDPFTINSVRLEMKAPGTCGAPGASSRGARPVVDDAQLAATGGTIVDLDGFRYHDFTSSGTSEVTSAGDPVTVEVLLVGGGGRWRRQRAAGGGGGRACRGDVLQRIARHL